MLSEIEKCCISTLCKPEKEYIEKVKDYFKSTVRKIFEEKTELVGQIKIGYIGEERRSRAIKFKDQTIPVCRLAWNIVCKNDMLNTFFEEWNKMDTNPCRSFRVVRDYSSSLIAYLMSIYESEKEEQ